MDREIGSLADAIALINEWERAYADLQADHTRLMQRYMNTMHDLSHARAAISNDLWLEDQSKPTFVSECPF